MCVCVCVACTRQLDVVIILDLSGSIEEVQRYDAMVALARAVSVGLPVASGRARVGAITYDSTAADQFYLSTYDRDVQGLLNAFEFNHARGSTNTQAALDLAFTSQVRLALCLSVSLSVCLCVCLSVCHSRGSTWTSPSHHCVVNVLTSNSTFLTFAVLVV